ncbi:MAG: hypothetical protein RIQ78_783 [Bacteroidota bacterium]|jgi:cell division septation protein DedD
MKNKSVIIYFLSGALALTLLIASYYAYQKQINKQIKEEQDEAELQQTLRDLGYAQGDTATTTTGSAFVGGDTTVNDVPKPTADQGAIAEKPISNPPPTTLNQPKSKVASKAAPVASSTTTPKGISGPGSGRWAVRAGTFANQEGARRRLEDVIKQGYPNAAIVKTSDGKAAVVVFRSEDKKAAIRVVDQLEDKGIDAAVFDRKN